MPAPKLVLFAKIVFFAGLVLLQVIAMNGNPQESQPPKIFCGKTHVGWFSVVIAEQSEKKRETGIPGIFAVGYRITLEGRQIKPAAKQRRYVVIGQKGEGLEAGALGLEDWLPTMIGDECVLAFDADHFTHAKYAVYLGGGSESSIVWRDCESFAAGIRPDGGMSPAGVAGSLAKPEPPRANFFRLIFDYDRSVWNDAAVLRAMAGYLGNAAVPSLERRAALAHYMSRPVSNDAEVLRAFSSGMLKLAAELAAARNIPSSGVILERLRAFFETTSGRYAFSPPDISAQEREHIAHLLASDETGASGPTRASLRGWLIDKH